MASYGAVNENRHVFETERLRVREYRRDDWRHVVTLTSDEAVVRYMPWDAATPSASQAFVKDAIYTAQTDPRRVFDWVVELKASGSVLGGCGVHIGGIRFFARETYEGAIHFWLGRAAWGQGFGTEISKGLLGFGFTHLRLHRVFATCDTRNLRSAHVLSRSRMSYEGTIREHVRQRGEWRSSLLFSMLEHEWSTEPDASTTLAAPRNFD